MIRIFRAAGIAAVGVALIAAASSPSLALDLVGAPDAGFVAHESAALEESDLALNEEAGLPPVAAPAVSGIGLVLHHAVSWLSGAAEEDIRVPIKPRSLDELVGDYAATATTGVEQDCLANAVYFEARGEPIAGQLAVAEVVMNRAASGRYPATLCAVVTQKAQFSFIRDGAFPAANRSSAAWRKAVAIAHIAEARLARKLKPDVFWYHASTVAPSWRRSLNRQTKIGLHIFYS